MNDREQLLVRGLADEADHVDVDVEALWRRVQEETGGSPRSLSSPRRGRVLVPVLAGLAAAAVVTAIGVAQLPDDASGPGPSKVLPAAGPVDARIGDWACDDQATLSPGREPDPAAVENGNGVDRGAGDSRSRVTRGDTVTLVPARRVVEPGSPPAEATEYGVPYYHFVLDGDSGRLLYGDDQRRLISTTQLVLDGGEWVMADRTVCAGIMGLPSPYATKLAAYTSAPVPFPADSLQVGEVPPTGDPVVLDDRTYYNEVGLLQHSTLYAYPTARGVMVINAPDDSSSSMAAGFAPGHTFAVNLIDGWAHGSSPYSFRGWDQGEVFAVFSKDDDVTGLSTDNLRTGQTGLESSVRIGGGTLYLALTLPDDEVQRVTTHHADGSDHVEVY